MIKKKQEKINNNFFNKLFFQFSTIKNININIKHFHKTNNVYYSETHKLWFARGEDENKYYYIFGTTKKGELSIEPTNYKLLIDFSKNDEYCDDCIGILTINNLYFHKNNFIKNYPNFDLNNYIMKELVFPSKNNKRIQAIEIGTISDFINQLKTIITEVNSNKNPNNN